MTAVISSSNFQNAHWIVQPGICNQLPAGTIPAQSWYGVSINLLSVMSDPRPTLLRKAAALVGHDELAAALKVPRSLLDAWMNGQATMPDRKLTLLADFLDGISNPPKQR